MEKLEPVQPAEAVKFLFPDQTTQAPPILAASPRQALSGGQVVFMAFGLPLMTAGIILGSLYLGHIVTARGGLPWQRHTAQTQRSVNAPAATPEQAVATPAGQGERGNEEADSRAELVELK